MNLPMAPTLPIAPTGGPSQELSAQQIAALQAEVRELASTRDAVNSQEHLRESAAVINY